jgi:predicted amidophosphoribosyltransferase
LRPQERRENLKGVFTVRPGIVPPGSTVLLADDVLTTGSTAHEAALALVQAGAARVVVAVVARGLGKDQA